MFGRGIVCLKIRDELLDMPKMCDIDYDIELLLLFIHN